MAIGKDAGRVEGDVLGEVAELEHEPHPTARVHDANQERDDAYNQSEEDDASIGES